MAQHDYNIANASFPTVRSDINDVLSAINTSNSGTSRPSGAVAGTIWLDTSGGATAHILKFYDGGADINLATINTTANTVDFTDSSVTFDIVNDTSPQLGGNLDTNSHNIGIDVAQGILDENSNEQLILHTTASAVNYIDDTSTLELYELSTLNNNMTDANKLIICFSFFSFSLKLSSFSFQ